MKAVVISVSICILLIVPLSQAWGPFSHQSFGCLVMNTPTINECLSSQHNLHFLMGAASPDAVKGISPKMHSLDYSGFQYLFSLNYSAPAGFDAVAFASGYGSHLAEDAVGHYSPGGWINPAHDHESEFAADSYQVKAWGNNTFKYQPLNDDAVDFFYAASTAYHTAVPSFTALTHDQISAAAKQFNSLTDKETLAIAVNFLYKEELKEWDVYGASSYAVAESHLLAARTNSTLAARYWLDQITVDTWQVAAQATQKYVQAMMS